MESISTTTAQPASAAVASASRVLQGLSGTSVIVYKLVDVTDTKNRRLHLLLEATAALLLVAAVVSWLTSMAKPLATQSSMLKGMGLAAALASISAGFYSHRVVKQRLLWTVPYKGHKIVFDGSGTFAERLYLDEGLVRHGGVGMKMEIRTTIKAGDGLGDEIIVWYDAKLFSCRCRIAVEEKR